MKIQCYPYDFTYKVIESVAEIRIFARTVDGERICLIDRNFPPYFYVKIARPFADFEQDVAMLQLEKGTITKVEEVEKNYMGETIKLAKVTVDMPMHVPSISTVFNKIGHIFESDIRFIRRYIIDKQITPLCLTVVDCESLPRKMKVPTFLITSLKQVDETSMTPRVLALDIETYTSTGMIQPDKDPIIMISLHGEGFSKVITWKKFKTSLEYIEFVDSEIALLERAFECITQYKPDFITGYNSDGFDLPFINTRSEKYGITTTLGLDGSGFLLSKSGRQQVYVHGIVHVDLYQFIRQVIGKSMKTTSLTLNNVAHELLGETKLEVDITTLTKAWDDNKGLQEFARYNLKDSVLTHKLFQQLWPNIEGLVKIVGLSPLDLTRASFSQLVENFILKQTAFYNELAPNRPSYSMTENRRRSRFTGAFVKEPIPGLYNDIVVMDFRSLYPSIITAHNISPGTLNCRCCEGGKNRIEVPGATHWFCEQQKGFIARILEEIITRRMRVKEIMKEKGTNTLLMARSEALKLLSNSFYGYLGFSAARWYSFECSQSITAKARTYIQDVMMKAEEEGFAVLYGDTDSVFLALEGKSKQDAILFKDIINVDLPGLMELEYEQYCPSGIFVATKHDGGGAKKRYALLKEEGGMEIKGFETVRRNVSAIAKETQEQVLRLVLEEHNPSHAIELVKSVIKDLREHETDKGKVIIKTQLRRPLDSYESIGPHVAAAIRLKEQGTPMSVGSAIHYYVAEGKGKIRDRVRLTNEETMYDAEYYINHQIIPAVEQILNVFGTSKQDLIKDHAQSTLGSFS